MEAVNFYSSYSTYVKNTGPYGNGGNKYFNTVNIGSTASTSTTTDALVVAGCIGCGENVYIEGGLYLPTSWRRYSIIFELL